MSPLSINLADAVWRKSTRSSASGNACIEIALVSQILMVRDSKNVTGSVLNFATSAWQTFAAEIKCGQYDRIE